MQVLFIDQGFPIFSIDLTFLENGAIYDATIYKDPEDGGWINQPEKIEIESTLLTNKDTQARARR